MLWFDPVVAIGATAKRQDGARAEPFKAVNLSSCLRQPALRLGLSSLLSDFRRRTSRRASLAMLEAPAARSPRSADKAAAMAEKRSVFR
ncbi:MAG: hypothetical protein M3Z29_01590, partial [Pseudomonadota bacterium]|nr:hypothetical protein [Pseudomonadota bacterium]